MKNKYLILIPTALVLVLVVIQSTIFHYISPDIVIPDLPLLVVAFCGARKGMMEGQILGFCNGLAEDFLTVSLPGFNALIKTMLGFFAGTLKNKIIFDPVLFPVIFIFIITGLKGLLADFTAYLFFEPEFFPSVFTRGFLFEIVLNSLLAPIVFYLLKLSKIIPSDIWGNQN